MFSKLRIRRTVPCAIIDTYRNLKKISKGKGLEVHHIVEKRFSNVLNIENTNDMLSIIMTKSDHKAVTKAWRELLPYGKNTPK